MTVEDLLDAIDGSVSTGTTTLIAGHNLHSAYLSHTDKGMRRFYETADIVLCDGAPVLWDYRLSGGAASNTRIGSTDWIPELHALSGLKRVLVIGSDAQSNERCTARLSRILPEVMVEGLPGDDWGPEKEQRALTHIEAFQPQVILIGLGMPRQEEFATRVVDLPGAYIVATVGGAIDQLAGTQRNAPRWLGRFGIEWAWRLVTQPRRLWRRYLVEPWMLVAVRIKQRYRAKTP